MIHISRNEVSIYNYESLLSVRDGELEVKYQSGVIKLCGSSLKIVAMNEEELRLGGCIKEVLFI